MNKTQISGTGCSLADLLYTNIDFSDEVFKKYISKSPGDGGLIPGNLVFVNELEKYAGENIDNILAKIMPGGKPDAFNLGGPCIVALINAGQLLREEAKVNFYGAYGEDNTGEELTGILKQTPININNYLQKKGLTPFTYVFSDPDYNKDGERIFVNNIGAAWEYSPSDLKNSFFKSDILVFGATALVPQIHDNLSQLLEKGKKSNSINIVTTVYDFRNEKKNPGKKWPLGKEEGYYRFIDLLIADKEEALKISGEDNLKSAAGYFKEKGISSFIITNGANNFMIYSDGNLFKKESRKELPVSEDISNELKNNPEKKGDTTGCGDNFAGGVIGSLVSQLTIGDRPDIIKAAAMGTVSGGFACFYNGGVWLEKERGEKYKKLNEYYEKYLKQIDYLKADK